MGSRQSSPTKKWHTLPRKWRESSEHSVFGVGDFALCSVCVTLYTGQRRRRGRPTRSSHWNPLHGHMLNDALSLWKLTVNKVKLRCA